MITLGQQFLTVERAFADVDSTRPSLTAPTCFTPLSIATYGLCLQTPNELCMTTKLTHSLQRAFHFIHLVHLGGEQAFSSGCCGGELGSVGKPGQCSPARLRLPCSACFCA